MFELFVSLFLIFFSLKTEVPIFDIKSHELNTFEITNQGYLKPTPRMDSSEQNLKEKENFVLETHDSSNKKIEALNINSGKVIASVAEIAVESSPALTACSDNPELCPSQKPNKPKPSATPTPTPITLISITPTPVPKPTIIIDPVIPPPVDEPPIEPIDHCGCNDSEKSGIRCIMELAMPCMME